MAHSFIRKTQSNPCDYYLHILAAEVAVQALEVPRPFFLLPGTRLADYDRIVSSQVHVEQL